MTQLLMNIKYSYAIRHSLFSAFRYTSRFRDTRNRGFPILALPKSGLYAIRYTLFIALPARAAVTIQNPLGEGTTIAGTITRIVDFIFQLGLAIAVIVFLVGGFQYLFSFGSEQKVEQAKTTLWYGVVGVVIMLVARSITALIKNILGA